MSMIFVEVGLNGYLPHKAHATDAGFDLRATHDFVVYPGAIVKHPLGIKLHLPAGTWAEIASKSGLGSLGLLSFAGVIDEGYRGEPHAILTNLSKAPIEIKAGQKLAQMLLHPHHNNYQMVQVTKVAVNTTRGTGGFGSTGK